MRFFATSLIGSLVLVALGCAGGNQHVKQATETIPEAQVLTPLFGNPTGPGFQDGKGGAARFNRPAGITGGMNSIFLADGENNAVRRISLDGEVVTLAGAAAPGFADGYGAEARFLTPSAVALDESGNLYVADEGNHAIRRIAVDSGRVETIAGVDPATVSKTTLLSGCVDGVGLKARFNAPRGLVFWRHRLYVADSGNGRVRVYDPSSQAVTTVVEGLGRPCGLAFAEDGRLFVSDEGRSCINVVEAGRARKWAGSTPGYRNGHGEAAMFSGPGHIAIFDGGLVVADRRNAAIRYINLATAEVTTISDSNPSVSGMEDMHFTAPFGVASMGSQILVTDGRGEAGPLAPPTQANLVRRIERFNGDWRGDLIAGASTGYEYPRALAKTPEGILVVDPLGEAPFRVGNRGFGQASALSPVAGAFWRGKALTAAIVDGQWWRLVSVGLDGVVQVVATDWQILLPRSMRVVGDEVYVLEPWFVVRINLATGETTGLFRVSEPCGLAVEGNHVFVSTATSLLESVDMAEPVELIRSLGEGYVDGAAPRFRPYGPVGGLAVALAPDGKPEALLFGEENGIRRWDLAKRVMTTVVGAGVTVDHPSLQHGAPARKGLALSGNPSLYEVRDLLVDGNRLVIAAGSGVFQMRF